MMRYYMKGEERGGKYIESLYGENKKEKSLGGF